MRVVPSSARALPAASPAPLTTLTWVSWAASTAAARLHVVTGKGGTGKSTVAAAMALALAAGGRRTLLIEVEGRQGIAQLFDTPPLPYEERRVAVAPGGGEVFGLAIDANEAVLEYLEMYYRLGRAGKLLDRLGALEFATTIAPGLRDVLLIGKTYEAVRRLRPGGGHTYDAVVLDAPPTGRIGRFLNVNEEVTTLARAGPIHRQARSIMDMLRRRTMVHLVTILEEMPVQETVDGIAELEQLELPVGAVVVNLVEAPQVPDLGAAGTTVDLEELRAGLARVGLPAEDDVVLGLARTLEEHATRVAMQAEERARLDALHVPVVELPRLPGGIDLGALYQLAERLDAQPLPARSPAAPAATAATGGLTRGTT
jgi:anion-transporting  ArsA/GET3 family ATPase